MKRFVESEAEISDFVSIQMTNQTETVTCKLFKEIMEKSHVGDGEAFWRGESGLVDGAGIVEH